MIGKKKAFTENTYSVHINTCLIVLSRVHQVTGNNGQEITQHH